MSASTQSKNRICPSQIYPWIKSNNHGQLIEVLWSYGPLDHIKPTPINACRV